MPVAAAVTSLALVGNATWAGDAVLGVAVARVVFISVLLEMSLR
jgi:hypothetical protein